MSAGNNLMHSLEKNRGTEGLEGLGREEGNGKETGEEGTGKEGEEERKEKGLKMRRPHPILVPQPSHVVPQEGQLSRWHRGWGLGALWYPTQPGP